ncbi:helix-turn-helix domain-containing protein [Pseudonocardia sp.]|uniref:helix-turn-helix domain-containing protein n=1 Tax=Pseudonocardia sp. TaxID=60912 RepID=UPI003D153200
MARHVSNDLGRLDDEDYPAVTMGQAAELLGVQPGFLRSLDSAGVLHPHRTGGGHRRYSRRQLALAARLRELLDAGHPLASAYTISGLEGELVASDTLRRESDDAHALTRSELESARTELESTRADLRDAQARLEVLQERPGSRAT